MYIYSDHTVDVLYCIAEQHIQKKLTRLAAVLLGTLRSLTEIAYDNHTAFSTSCWSRRASGNLPLSYERHISSVTAPLIG